MNNDNVKICWTKNMECELVSMYKENPILKAKSKNIYNTHMNKKQMRAKALEKIALHFNTTKKCVDKKLRYLLNKIKLHKKAPPLKLINKRANQKNAEFQDLISKVQSNKLSSKIHYKHQLDKTILRDLEVKHITLGIDNTQEEGTDEFNISKEDLNIVILNKLIVNADVQKTDGYILLEDSPKCALIWNDVSYNLMRDHDLHYNAEYIRKMWHDMFTSAKKFLFNTVSYPIHEAAGLLSEYERLFLTYFRKLLDDVESDDKNAHASEKPNNVLSNDSDDSNDSTKLVIDESKSNEGIFPELCDVNEKITIDFPLKHVKMDPEAYKELLSSHPIDLNCIDSTQFELSNENIKSQPAEDETTKNTEPISRFKENTGNESKETYVKNDVSQLKSPQESVLPSQAASEPSKETHLKNDVLQLKLCNEENVLSIESKENSSRNDVSQLTSSQKTPLPFQVASNESKETFLKNVLSLQEKKAECDKINMYFKSSDSKNNDNSKWEPNIIKKTCVLDNSKAQNYDGSIPYLSQEEIAAIYKESNMWKEQLKSYTNPDTNKYASEQDENTDSYNNWILWSEQNKTYHKYVVTYLNEQITTYNNTVRFFDNYTGYMNSKNKMDQQNRRLKNWRRKKNIHAYNGTGMYHSSITNHAFYTLPNDKSSIMSVPISPASNFNIFGEYQPSYRGNPHNNFQMYYAYWVKQQKTEWIKRH